VKTKKTINSNENKQTIDRLFKEKLADREHAVSIESAVVLQYGLKKIKTKQTFFYWISGFAILFLLLGGGVYLWQNHSFQPKKQQAISRQQLKNKEVLNKTTTSIPIPQAQHEEQVTMTANNKEVKSSENISIGNANKHYRFSTTPFTAKTEGKVQRTNSSLQQQSLQNNPQGTSSVEEPLKYIQSQANTQYGLSVKTTPETKITLLPVPGNINTTYPEYAPVINADGSILFFTSRRPTESSEKRKKAKLKESIFLSNYDKVKKTWEKSKLAPFPLNKKLTFASAVGLSNDGQQLFVYQDDKTGNGNIYSSKLKGSTWSELQKLPYPINTKYLETTVSLSPDGNTMYIASNRPGGYGGLDLWYSVKNKDGSWKEPVNLGPDINTSGNEEGVYIHPDGKTLYFHSNGHKGMGGYDIYYSLFEKGKWSKPINMGASINGPGDDVYFTIDAAKKIGYFASKRKDGKGETDIYKVEFNYLEKKSNASSLTLFKGEVLDKQTNKPLEAEIEIIDLEKNETISEIKSNAATGNFLISLPSGKNYGINVKKHGYLFYSENMNIPKEASYNEVVKTVLLDKLRADAKIILKNIFYDYGKATLRKSSINELDRLYELMVQNPKLKVELSAYTDSRGSDVFNLELSEQRAQSCVEYLISKGIDSKRLIPKGYGETQPWITDEEINKMPTEAEKESAYQKNRRTEIKIIKN